MFSQSKQIKTTTTTKKPPSQQQIHCNTHPSQRGRSILYHFFTFSVIAKYVFWAALKNQLSASYWRMRIPGKCFTWRRNNALFWQFKRTELQRPWTRLWLVGGPGLGCSLGQLVKRRRVPHLRNNIAGDLWVTQWDLIWEELKSLRTFCIWWLFYTKGST